MKSHMVSATRSKKPKKLPIGLPLLLRVGISLQPILMTMNGIGSEVVVGVK
jgi:hypothetical protein